MKDSNAKIVIPLQNRGEVSLLIVVVRKFRTFISAGILVVFFGWYSFCDQNVSDQPFALTSVLANRTDSSQELTVAETAWGTLQVGSWIRRQTTTTTFQDKISKSVAESTMVLEAIEPDGILLKQTDSVEVGGKMVPGEPQPKKIDFYQQSLAGNGTVQILPSEDIPIGNRTFSCGVRVYEQTTSQLRRRTKVWFNPEVAPYVLRTETIRTSIPTQEQPAEKLLGHSVSVVLNPPKTTLRGSFFGTYRMKTVKKDINGTVYSLAECSLRVPGWVASERSWEYDQENNLIRTQIMTFSETVKSTEAGAAEAVVGRQPSVISRQ